MRVVAEEYKGIEFVRISNLPDDQKEKIKSGLTSDQIIKILKAGDLLEDCIQYSDYLSWFERHMAGPVYTAHQQAQPKGVYKLLTR